jgi:hypothetical protein
MSDDTLLSKLGLINQNFLWASLIWGSIGSGYFIYGWKQRATIPLVGGVVMTAVSFFAPALTMSLVCIAVMFAVWWLMKNGY